MNEHRIRKISKECAHELTRMIEGVLRNEELSTFYRESLGIVREALLRHAEYDHKPSQN